MRIVALCGFAWEPKGTVRARAFPILHELANRGHQVTLLTIPYDNPQLSGVESVRDGVFMRALPLDSNFSKVLELPLRAIREIEALRPDVVHIFKPKGYAGAVATLLLGKRRLPVTIDCDDWEGWGGWNEAKQYPYLIKEYIDLQEKWLIRRADALTVASRVLRDRALRIGQRASQIFYAPNGVTGSQLEQLGEIAEMAPSQLKQELGLAGRQLILYAGHFEPPDEILFFCRSVVASLRAGAQLAFVGDGEEMPKVRQFFAALPDLPVRYFGRLPYEKYLRVIGAADVACFPYPDAPVYRAKCSARIIDYMACAKPVVTTNVGQNPEYIISGESGVLVDPHDEEKLSLALTSLMANADLRSTIGAHARKRISQLFTWNGGPVQECEQSYRAARHSFQSRRRSALATEVEPEKLDERSSNHHPTSL
jgi:glycosyltransferase involved in cell wall biosynthesis